jgi:NitT/TauT family transport system substrate-binding protein
VAIEKGFFTAAGIKPDTVFAQSNAAVIQQVAAGSINVSTNSGLVDPIRAIQKGAPLAIVRIEVQVPPYSLLAKPAIKTMKDLKGKLVSLGGAKDITRIFVEQMLAPNGVKPGEFDMTFAGATSARFSALQAGAVDAAILTPPFNFHAQTAGFTLLGNTVEYVDMPFAGISVNTNWAAANKDTAEKLIKVYNDSITWLYDPKNRDEAVEILMKVSKIKKDDVDKAYDFLIGGKYFEPTGRVSKSRLNKLVDALKSLGDVPQEFSVETLFLPGVTQTAN